ncbi:MAG TPA: hypothetical protein VFO44_11925 [Steroidobacteraceae bacterium]|nr:hypothetical protein [Steroidobacteraceae bacterium]
MHSISYSPGSAAEVLAAVRAMRLEGVVAKHKDSPYQRGERLSDWVKLKLEKSQELVIGGYRSDGSIGLDALLVGYYEGKELRFAGKVRAGLVPHTRRELLGKLKSLHVARRPFANLPDFDVGRWGGGVTAEQMTEMQWVKPELVAQMQPGTGDSGALGGELYAVSPRFALFLGAHFAMDTDSDDEDQHESQQHSAVLRTRWVYQSTTALNRR